MVSFFPIGTSVDQNSWLSRVSISVIVMGW
jgi:hypothetical protein